MNAVAVTISILNSKGDVALSWNPGAPEDVERARATVAELKAQGYSFFLADGTPADEVAAGAGDLRFRRVDDPVTELTTIGAVPAPDAPRRRGRPAKAPEAVALPPMRGG